MSFNHYAKPLLAVCASLFAIQTPAQDPTHNIDVEAQPLPGALQEFSEQTNLQLAYVATLAKGKDSPGTQGKTRPKAALSDILDGTELEYQYVNAKTVAIGSRRAEAAGDSAPGGSQPAPEPILLAQSQETEQDEPGGDSDASSDDAEVSDADVEEIIVTGSRMPRTPSQIAANLVTMDQGVLQATGEASLDKALRTLPQNQLGASSLASYARLGGQHFNGAINLSGASAVNLRGLGNVATLVLVDGKRIGSSGLAGGVTDISGIPTASIERVEIMLDGASAIYGSDAVGGVVNIITRKDYEGAELEVMHSAPDRGGFDESALTLSGSWLWGETRMRGNVQASSHSPLYGRDRPGKYDSNNFCKKGCIRGGTQRLRVPGNALPAESTSTRHNHQFPRGNGYLVDGTATRWLPGNQGEISNWRCDRAGVDGGQPIALAGAGPDQRDAGLRS